MLGFIVNSDANGSFMTPVPRAWPIAVFAGGSCLTIEVRWENRSVSVIILGEPRLIYFSCCRWPQLSAAWPEWR